MRKAHRTGRLWIYKIQCLRSTYSQRLVIRPWQSQGLSQVQGGLIPFQVQRTGNPVLQVFQVDQGHGVGSTGY